MSRKRKGASDSHFYYKWLDKALCDLQCARLLLTYGGDHYNIAFHCQQAIEKALKGWLIKITVNCAHEHHRKTARLSYTDDLEPLAGGAEDRHDFTLWDAVCALPEDYRVATVLFYYEDMTTAEIANALGIREGTVRSRLSRARNRLRTLLEEE